MAAKKQAKKEAPEAQKKTTVAHAPKEHAHAPQTPFTTTDPKLAGVRLRGKEFTGLVISDKAAKTVTVEWERRVLIPKYERYERRFSRVYAHNPIEMNARTGDIVRIKETRPLSKTKHFVVIEVVKREVAQ